MYTAPCWLVAASLLCSLAMAAESSIEFGEQGLRSIRVAGQELLLDGQPGCSAQWDKDGGGREPARSEGKAAPPAGVWSAERRTLTRDYGWARLEVAYASPAPGRLDASITVVNTGSRALHQVMIDVARLAAPGLPEWYPSQACAATEPPVLAIRSTEWSGAWLEQPGAAMPASLELAGERERPAAGNRPAVPAAIRLRIGAGDGRIILHGLQLDRPIAPGASDRYAVSLRLGTPGTAVTALASDALAAYAAVRPATLAWKDRRPVLRCFWGGGLPKEQVIANATDPANAKLPTAAGAKFREQAVNKVKSILVAAKEVDAQAIIFWDFEGGTFPHPTTYIGDPRLTAVFNPEMDLIADELMRMCREAGLAVGVCIRPSRVIFSPEKGTYWHSHSVEKDPQKELDEKIAYCRKRWDCRVFYIDTSVFWKPYPPKDKWEAAPIAPDIWKALAAKYPDTLLIPECNVDANFAHIAPYGEADMGNWGVNPVVKAAWPDAFRVIVIEDADPWENFDRFVQAVRERNALMTFGQGLSGNVQATKHITLAARLLDQGAPPAVAAAAPAALPALLADPELAVRFHAALALAKAPAVAGAGATLAAAATRADEAWVVRRAALTALPTQGVAEADIPGLIALCLDAKSFLHVAAGLAVAKGGPAAIAALDAAIRSAAAQDTGKNRNNAFIRLCDAAGDSGSLAIAATVRTALAGMDEKRDVERTAAVETLGRLRDREAVPAIVALMAASSGNLQVACVAALARIGDAEALAQARTLVEAQRLIDKDRGYKLAQALKAK